MQAFTHPTFPYVRSPDQDVSPRSWPVVVVGAGPVGLVAAIDLALRGIDVLVLDDDNTVSVGSRAICWSKRTLEILDRLGCGDAIVAKGVGWNRGRVFFQDEQVYDFELHAEAGQRRPAFVNLQQYWVEHLLVQRLAQLPRANVRWHNRVVGVAQGANGVALDVDTPDGRYTVHADWLLAADGARSPVRDMLGLECEGQAFRDRFLIVDVRMQDAFPTERWFWFDPPFHRNQSALLHRQADGIWRIDFQLGWDADPDVEKDPDNIARRLRAMLGAAAKFDVLWASVYTFACRRMRSFVHDRVVFIGDAAHLVSPFGARGANSGIQDADNVGWKLALVVEGLAPQALIASYDAERTLAADDNLAHSTRSADFITPKNQTSRTFRDGVLMLAKRHAFARQFINSGRLSQPAVLRGSVLSSPDVDVFDEGVPIGAAAVDAPVRGARGDWLLGYLDGGFVLLVFGDAPAASAITRLAACVPACALIIVDGETTTPAQVLRDVNGLLAKRYAAETGTCYLFRPDQHVCARWRTLDVGLIEAAIARASCRSEIATTSPMSATTLQSHEESP